MRMSLWVIMAITHHSNITILCNFSKNFRAEISNFLSYIFLALGENFRFPRNVEQNLARGL